MLESLVDKGDKAAHRHSPRKDMDSQHVAAMEKFLQQSFLWPEMMDLHGTFQHLCCVVFLTEMVVVGKSKSRLATN